MQWGLSISDRDWCDYVVYCPYATNCENIMITRLKRDEKEIADLEAGADIFIDEMLALYEKVKAL